MTVEECSKRADEAERMAATVSYGKDRDMLLKQAEEWRQRAAALEVQRSMKG